MRSLLICKPNSVCLKKDRANSGRSSFIWDWRHRQPQAVYPHRSGRALLSPEGERCCLTLHPMRFTCPTLSPTLPVGSYPHPFTHHLCPEGSSAGLLSVALAVTARRRLPVRKHGALWCSDFPQSPIGERDDPISSLLNQICRAEFRRKLIDQAFTPLTASWKRAPSTMIRPVCSHATIRLRWRISS